MSFITKKYTKVLLKRKINIYFYVYECFSILLYICSYIPNVKGSWVISFFPKSNTCKFWWPLILFGK